MITMGVLETDHLRRDPYARVLLSGIQKGRTVTFTNELNPTWDEIVYVCFPFLAIACGY